nr:uracil-DNA glycosylase [Kitasatospora purpeofusca]
MAEFDRGPTDAFAELFARVPDPPDPPDPPDADPPGEAAFWSDWGPVFYRGRLDGSARVLVVASDPGPTERIAGRTLVGNAGQRVQGFLARLGLTRSYVCLNAWAYAVRPSFAGKMKPRLADPAQAQWRNELYGAVAGPALEAVVAMGGVAQEAVRLWTGRPAGSVLVQVPHPSSHTESTLLDGWRAAIDTLRPIVTPDEDGDNTGPNYGTVFEEGDYRPVPARDLPFGVPAFLGDDAWVRALGGAEQNSVRRPVPDDLHTLIWKAPDR